MVDRADRRGGRVLPRPAARRLRRVLRIPRGISRLPARAPGPILLWSAFRLGRRAAMTGVLLLTGLAIYGTLSGYGPFVRSTPTASIAMVLLA